jgi:hypothetical protein
VRLSSSEEESELKVAGRCIVVQRLALVLRAREVLAQEPTNETEGVQGTLHPAKQILGQ